MYRIVLTLTALLCLSGCSHYVHEQKYFLHGVEEADSTNSWNKLACGESSVSIPAYLYSRKIYLGFIVPFLPLQHIKRKPYRIDATGMAACPTIVQAKKQMKAQRRENICYYDNQHLAVTKDLFIEGLAGCQSDAVRYEKRIERDYCFVCIP